HDEPSLILELVEPVVVAAAGEPTLFAAEIIVVVEPEHSAAWSMHEPITFPGKLSGADLHVHDRPRIAGPKDRKNANRRVCSAHGCEIAGVPTAGHERLSAE